MVFKFSPNVSRNSSGYWHPSKGRGGHCGIPEEALILDLTRWSEGGDTGHLECFEEPQDRNC